MPPLSDQKGSRCVGLTASVVHKPSAASVSEEPKLPLYHPRYALPHGFSIPVTESWSMLGTSADSTYLLLPWRLLSKSSAYYRCTSVLTLGLGSCRYCGRRVSTSPRCSPGSAHFCCDLWLHSFGARLPLDFCVPLCLASCVVLHHRPGESSFVFLCRRLSG